jgi:hypothetical protein
VLFPSDDINTGDIDVDSDGFLVIFNLLLTGDVMHAGALVEVLVAARLA